MQNNLFFSLTLNISLLVLMATILTEVRPLRMILKRQDRSVSSQLVLGAIFGVLSISCTYTGLAFQGAVVNTRVVSTVAAGLVGGPISGLCADQARYRQVADACQRKARQYDISVMARNYHALYQKRVSPKNRLQDKLSAELG